MLFQPHLRLRILCVTAIPALLAASGLALFNFSVGGLPLTLTTPNVCNSIDGTEYFTSFDCTAAVRVGQTKGWRRIENAVMLSISYATKQTSIGECVLTYIYGIWMCVMGEDDFVCNYAQLHISTDICLLFLNT